MEVRTAESLVTIENDPVQSAKTVGLRYVSDSTPGIRRLGSQPNFRYLNEHGKPVRDSETLQRITSLAIPPAWQRVWICPLENGHLQATGFDARGRKQYRYHKRWREVRDETKYTRMIVFGKALPRIRRRVENDLGLPGLPREKVLATILRLMDSTYIRVGNEEYAKENNSYGLTTMQDKHAEINGSKIRFKFRGKSAKRHIIDIHDARLAKIVRKCQDLPGQELFQYIDSDGQVQDVKSEDVNAYLREISGEDFTAKDFRTWAGTVLAARELCVAEPGETKAQVKKIIVTAIESVAARLGNTPAVCRKAYVHPVIFESFQTGVMIELMGNGANAAGQEHPPSNGLSSEEKCVLRLLERHAVDRQEPLIQKLKRSIAARKQKR